MTESTPTKDKAHTSTALMPYGERDEVIALSKRIMAMHPSARAIGERGAHLLAQLGIALGLNPMPGTGHIHAWIDNSGVLCVHIGLEGRMALARQDSPFSISTRPMKADERDLHGLQQADRGAIAELYRHDHTQLFASLKLEIKPVTGIGIATGNELKPKGRSLQWRADQRAMKDAIRTAYSFKLPHGLSEGLNFVDDTAGVTIEGEFSEAGEGDKTEGGQESGAGNNGGDAGHQKESREDVNAQLFGDGEAGSVETSHATEPTPAPKRAPAKPNGEVPRSGGNGHTEAPKATTGKRKKANVITKAWFEAIIPVAEQFPKYKAKDGTADSTHLQYSAAAEGYSDITDDNLPLVIQAIRDRAYQNAQADAEQVAAPV